MGRGEGQTRPPAHPPRPSPTPLGHRGTPQPNHGATRSKKQPHPSRVSSFKDHVKAEYVCWLVFPGVRTGLSFINTLLLFQATGEMNFCSVTQGARRCLP